ncbi:hypothetical protein VM98_34145, partial [Streptomyces rubellomurinus subsp. indigoferus]
LLEMLRHEMVAVVAVVVVVAGAAGRLVAGRITGRLVRPTEAAELVAASGRLDVLVPAGGTDGVGRREGGGQRGPRVVRGGREQLRHRRGQVPCRGGAGGHQGGALGGRPAVQAGQHREVGAQAGQR